MKTRLLQIRVDAEFLSKLKYLQRINGYRNLSETVRKVVEKESRKETRTAHWIEHDEEVDRNGVLYPIYYVECSSCGMEQHDATMCRYCPNCGALMDKIDEERV